MPCERRNAQQSMGYRNGQLKSVLLAYAIPRSSILSDVEQCTLFWIIVNSGIRMSFSNMQVTTHRNFLIQI